MIASAIKFHRAWAMPNAETFSIKPIGALVQRFLRESMVSVDPFSRNKTWATFTNPTTQADNHVDAREFLLNLQKAGVMVDLVLFDPPYSPRQISECYQAVGRKVGMKDTQSAVLYSECRNLIKDLVAPDGIVISCGWNTVGMGINRGFELLEILLVCHGGAHNDTIVTVERKTEDA